MFEAILNIFQTLTVERECRRVLGLVFQVHPGRRGWRNVCNNVTTKLQHTIYVTERAALSRLPAAIKGSGALLVPQRSAERAHVCAVISSREHRCSSCILFFFMLEPTGRHTHTRTPIFATKDDTYCKYCKDHQVLFSAVHQVALNAR